MLRAFISVLLTLAAIVPRGAIAQSLPAPCGETLPAINGQRFVGPDSRQGAMFSLIIPQGFARVTNLEGFDSEVKQWVDSSHSSVGYDYGASINQPFLRRHLAHYRECVDTIGGLVAIVATGHDTAGTMASVVHVAKFVGVATWRGLDGGPHMSVIVTTREATSLLHGLSVLRSVRFP